MKDNSLYKLGGISSILVGISYMVIGVTNILLPPALTYANDAQSPFMYFEANRGLYTTGSWAWTLGALFALALIPAVSATVQHLNEGWVRWTSSLATLAFAVSFLDYYWAIVMNPPRAAAYVAGNDGWRAALTVPGAPHIIDAQGWLGFGAVGLWILVASLLALRGNAWPKGLAYVGIATAFFYFLALAREVIPSFSGIVVFTIVASGGGLVLAPIWYIWMGIHLRHMALQETK
jgi:hypothetical protein